MSFPPQEKEIVVVENSNDDVSTLGFESIQAHDDLSPLADNATLALKKTQKNGNTLLLTTGWERSIGTLHSVSDLWEAPYRKSDTLQLTAGYELPISEAWSGYAEGRMNLATGTSASLSDGYSMIATTGASYAVNPKLKFSIGLLTNKSLFDTVQAMPIIGLDWDITDRLKLRTLNGAFLSYELNRSTEIDLSLQYLDQSFAIENLQGTVFMRMDQAMALEESSVVGTLGVRHNWKDVFSIRAFAEITGNREFHTPSPPDDVNVIEIPETNDKRISFGVEGGIRF